MINASLFVWHGILVCRSRMSKFKMEEFVLAGVLSSQILVQQFTGCPPPCICYRANKRSHNWLAAPKGIPDMNNNFTTFIIYNKKIYATIN